MVNSNAILLLSVDYVCLWIVFSILFYNYYAALEIKPNHAKLLAGSFVFSFIDISIMILPKGLKWENLYFFLTIIFIICPVIWRSTNTSLLKVISVCLLVTGIQVSFTVLGQSLITPLLQHEKTGLVNLPIYKTILIYLSMHLVQIVLSILFHLLLKSKYGRRATAHLFQTTSLSWVTFFSSLFLAILMFFFIEIYYKAITANQKSIFYLFSIYLVVGVIFGLSLAVISYIRLYQERLKTAEAMLAQQQSYNHILEKIQQNIRHFQHDYKNILSSFYLQLQEGKIDEVQELLEEKFLSFDKNVSHKIKQMNFLNNIELMEIKSLLLTKMLQMEQKQIKFQIEVINPISNFHIDTEDLVRCLGILLDNAMEEESLTTEKTVCFIAYRENSTITIIVKNNLHDEAKVTDIYQDGYSTKGKNRGIGLSSYQKILTKYPNVLNKTIISNHQFQQVLKITNI